MTEHFCQPGTDQQRRTHGFSLVELLLALSLGISLSGMILQILINENALGLRVNRLLRERSVQQRTLALIREEVQRSSHISANPQLEQHACNLAGRLPVLHLSTLAGPITYSVGAAPSAIWRGQVLMRCGPAFDLLGQPSVGSSAQNRVVIDGLALNPEPRRECPQLVSNELEPSIDLSGPANRAFSACLDKKNSALAIRLIQQFSSSAKDAQTIKGETVISSSP